VKHHEVVPREGQPADGRLSAEASMGSVAVIAVQPSWQLGPTLLGGVERGCVCPFAQGGLDEALGLAVGLRRVWPGADVFDAEALAGLAERV